jgi:hypothetical protein
VSGKNSKLKPFRNSPVSALQSIWAPIRNLMSLNLNF